MQSRRIWFAEVLINQKQTHYVYRSIYLDLLAHLGTEFDKGNWVYGRTNPRTHVVVCLVLCSDAVQ